MTSLLLATIPGVGGFYSHVVGVPHWPYRTLSSFSQSCELLGANSRLSQ